MNEDKDAKCGVLIVEDEFIMRQGMKHMMDWEKEGFCVVGEASNGQEALELIEKCRPHIVLADIVMPVMDGIEFSEILKKKYSDIQLIILSGYDKFDYVKTTLLNGAVDYILKPTINPAVLLQSLKKAVSRIPGYELPVNQEVSVANCLEKVLLGYDKELRLETAKKEFPHLLYRLLAVDLARLCEHSKYEQSEAGKRMETYLSSMADLGTVQVMVGENLLCMVLNYKVKDDRQLLDLVQSLADWLEQSYSKVFLVMSGSFSALEELRQVYLKEIQGEINNTFYSHKNLNVVNDSRTQLVLERFPFEMYTMLLSQHRYEEALVLFEQYMYTVSENQMEEKMMKNLAKNLLYNYLMELEKYQVAGEALKEKYFAQIDSTDWVEEYQELMQNIIAEIRQVLSQLNGQEDLRIVEIKQYTAKHYKEPLELTDIARKFNFNYSYLSAYFSRSTKEGFTEYLNRIRIGEACELLKHTKATISSIGEEVGYAEHSYFCRVFKKITGETPSSYRRKNRKEV